jgi:hypothetical protein
VTCVLTPWCACQIFRGCGNIVLLFWVNGAVVLCWSLMGMDYARILELDPDVTTHQLCKDLWTWASELSIAFLVGFLCFYKAFRGVFLHRLPSKFAHTIPLVLFTFTAYYIATRCARRPRFFKLFRNTLLAPCGEGGMFGIRGWMTKLDLQCAEPGGLALRSSCVTVQNDD